VGRVQQCSLPVVFALVACERSVFTLVASSMIRKRLIMVGVTKWSLVAPNNVGNMEVTAPSLPEESRGWMIAKWQIQVI